jgi:plasmid stabilization system protein ParE
VKVELSAEAQAQVDRIDAWWRENRTAAPDLFAEELEAALRMLSERPALAVQYAAKPSVRRLLLRRTHHHLYVIEEAARLYVVAIWSAHRERGPAL